MNDMELAEEIERRRLKRGHAVGYEWLNSDECLGMLLKEHAEQIIAALRRGRERPPSGEMVMVLKSFAENRCHACGWPLAGNATDGCTPFNCSYRPNEQSAEHAAWLKKAHEMESVRTILSAAEASKEAK